MAMRPCMRGRLRLVIPAQAGIQAMCPYLSSLGFEADFQYRPPTAGAQAVTSERTTIGEMNRFGLLNGVSPR